MIMLATFTTTVLLAKTRIGAIVWCGVCLLFASPLFAANQTWQGDSGTLWQTTGNWSGNALPGIPDTAFFNDTATGTTVTSNNTTTVGTLNFSGGTAFTFALTNPIYLRNAAALTSTSSVQQTLGGTNFRGGATGNATFTNNGTGLIDFNADILKEDVSGASSSTNNGNLIFTGTGDWAVERVGKRFGNLQSGLTKQGTGTLTVEGAFNTFDTSGTDVTGLTGTITIANGGGRLRMQHVDALGTGNITIQTAGTNTGTLELALTGTNVFTNTFNGFSSANVQSGANFPAGNPQILNTSGDNTITSNLTVASTGGHGLNVASNGGLLTLAGNITTTVDQFRTLSLGGAASGIVSGNILNFGAQAFSVEKTGTGTWTLSGTGNTYTGTTEVRQGTLLANGVLSTTPIVVHNGATFGGTGVVGGSITVNNGGTLSPGAAIESLVAGVLTLNNGSTFNYQMDSSAALSVAADLQVVSGNLNLTGAVTLDLIDLAASPEPFDIGTTFSLLNYSGIWNGGMFTFGGATLADGDFFLAFGNQWQIDYDSTTGGANFTGDFLPNSLFVNITATPEPTSVTLWLGVAAMAFVGGWRLRSRRPHGPAK